MTILHLRKSIGRSPLRRAFLLIPLALAWLALSPTVRAVLPAPDGGYPGNNTAEGDDALFSLTTGTDNTAVGFNALYNNTGYFNTANGSQALLSNTTGQSNTANGGSALYSNTTGNYNTANGVGALEFNTTGGQNTATGSLALFFNTTGSDNTASGYQALYSNTTGFYNTASGDSALFSNTTGHDNTANGLYALYYNTAGSLNTANGTNALYSNTIGNYNTANGLYALYYNTIGNYNTANGSFALYNNTTGTQNTATGYRALLRNTTGINNTATGINALLNNTTGRLNIALGADAGNLLTTGSNNIDIGNAGVAAESGTIRIGTAGTQTKTFIAGISGATVASGVGVIVGSNGQLGTVVSSERFKDAIKPMDKASEAILALKPVTFHYKKELDPEDIPQFGLVAEEVEKVNPDLVARDAEGKVFAVRYEAVNAMLLNEFLKEHRTVQELKSTAAKQEATITKQQKQIEALTAGLQRVSAQVEMSHPAPQMVLNDQ